MRGFLLIGGVFIGAASMAVVYSYSPELATVCALGAALVALVIGVRTLKR
jgi:hypothetical protein